ncbi:hypothetical protein [Paraglaciecola arctica]|uniref:Uncharacterized protein n=1 Tax=Paraglaciecola arctica BSs20135 TaxID=493475 RepID=K6ZD28_9ALTE|nr:hypothetical protein [Paraglaciecola arctica]GAC21290.1 hypothetical protein GARC_4348 [Paraglaciecola arctica BSs20135]
MIRVLVFILFFPFTAVAGNESSIDTDVREVWSGGYWSYGDQDGVYRFIVRGGGIEHYKTKLYVQWLTVGTDYDKPILLKSVSIKELNDTPEYSFGLPECIAESRCSSVSLEATNTYDQSKYMIQIHMPNIGVYQYESAAAPL